MDYWAGRKGGEGGGVKQAGAVRGGGGAKRHAYEYVYIEIE